eukprot:4965989-Amphidinium_carterae.1
MGHPGQARDDERTVLASRTIEKTFSLYKEKLGRYPPEDAEPSPEQVTGDRMKAMLHCDDHNVGGDEETQAECWGIIYQGDIR